MNESACQSKDNESPSMNPKGFYGHYWDFAEGLVESHEGDERERKLDLWGGKKKEKNSIL